MKIAKNIILVSLWFITTYLLTTSTIVLLEKFQLQNQWVFYILWAIFLLWLFIKVESTVKIFRKILYRHLCKRNIHYWYKCKCIECGTIRNDYHDWNGCICRVCSSNRQSEHIWNGCTCQICKKNRQSDHVWEKNICKICLTISKDVETLLVNKVNEKGYSINLIDKLVKEESAKIFSEFGDFDIEFKDEPGYNREVTTKYYQEDPHSGMYNTDYSGWYYETKNEWVEGRTYLKINPPVDK
ncbi:MAG: hypothetical protein SFU99_05425 [Saprospiraceae bacterium]|nr:hypothetical protein [Saprospiraceae bacterium]